MLGEFLLNTSTSSGSGGTLGALEGDLTTFENNLKGDINGAIHDVAQALNIHDFYSMHIMDCEPPSIFGNYSLYGMLTSSQSVKATTNPPPSLTPPKRRGRT